MADGSGGDDRGAKRPQDSFVEKVRPDPAQPPERVVVFDGLLGDSDRPDRRRIYFSRELDSYAEVRTDDIVDASPIPEDQPPFVGLEATRLMVRRDAVIEYTQVSTGQEADEFDLDLRVASGPAAERQDTWRTECYPITRCGDCEPTEGRTCRTCRTCQTCNTCQTRCGQLTCDNTCGQATCNTCQTRCGQATCNCFGTCINTRCGTCLC
jgi:hypothetical protein